MATTSSRSQQQQLQQQLLPGLSGPSAEGQRSLLLQQQQQEQQQQQASSNSVAITTERPSSSSSLAAGVPTSTSASLAITTTSSAPPGSVSTPFPSNGRKSGIETPTMKLSGHAGEVLAVNFSPDGKNIASAGADREVFIYNVYGDVATWCILRGHARAVLDFQWSVDGLQIYTASADHTAAIWDAETGQRVKKLKGHVGIVNACSVASAAAATAPTRMTFGCASMLVTAADDGTTRVWDCRIRKSIKKYQHQYQVLSVALDGHGGRVFSGCLDNTIQVYDLRHGDKEVDVYTGHGDSITGLCINSSGTMLFSNSMDQTIRLWDIQPFISPGSSRQVAVLRGSTHNFEKNLLRLSCSTDEKLLGAGSADRNVCVWNVQEALLQSKKGITPTLLYRLPGHSGSVNDVSFHPTEPIIASASSDRTVFMGELG